MRYLKSALTIAVLLSSAIGSSAWAQHGHGGGHGGGHFAGGHGGHGGYYRGGGWHGGFGVVIGAPLYGPGWYGDPYYYDPYYSGYYATPTVVESAPPVYVESSPAPAQSATLSYCANPKGYYPNVKTCNVPWRSVDPASLPPPR